MHYFNNTPNFKELFDLGFAPFILPRGQKTPSIVWKGFQTNRPTVEQIDDWQGVNANAAIVTGSISNLLVLDVDSPAAQALVDGLDLPPTPTVKTAKGRHYYFAYPAAEVRNKVRLKGVELDVRGEGGYVVAAGSQHSDGSMIE